MSDDTTPPADQPGAGSPPPPPPSYGSEVPPPPPAYGAPPTGGGGYNAVDAVKYGWEKFIKSPATLLVPVLLTILAVGAVYVLMFFVILAPAFDSDITYRSDGTIDVDTGPSFIVRMILIGLMVLVVTVVLQVFLAALIKGGLDVADGKSPSIGELLQGWDKTQVLIAAVLVAAGTAVGSIACYVPGLIFSFLASYTQYFVVDKKLSAVEAIKASFTFTTSHLGETILFFLLSAVVYFVGAIACGIGLLAAFPVILIGQAYTFRILHNEPVSPVA